jgi:hypothetical protein
MKRRDFVKGTAAAGLLTLITPSKIIHALSRDEKTALAEGFVNPPNSARAHTWWHWMNGHVTADGITRDLEAMKKAGIGGFQNFSVGSGIPKGPVEYLSPEWLDLMKHTMKEAERLDLEFQMHNCPGWSSSGGPWITPELGMQQVVWSETFVKGGKKLKTALPQPLKRLGYYKDTFVLAFPSLADEQAAWYENLVKITSAKGTLDPKTLINGQGEGIEILPPSAGQAGYLQLEFSKPYEARSVLLYASAQTEPVGGGVLSVGPVAVEVSDNGTEFRKISDMQVIGGETPGSGTFPAVKAKYFRFSIPAASKVYQVNLSGAARITDWTTKANFAGAVPGQAFSEAKETGNIPAGSMLDPEKILDLSQYMDANGNLTWQAPKGNWTILRFGHTATGRLNKAAPTTGIGLECDKFSKAAFDFHFNKMFENLLPALKPLAAKGKVGVLIDSYEVGMQNWSKDFPQEFKSSRGYEVVKYLPAITGRVIGSVEATERVLWDIRRVQSDLMANNYYGRCTELCHQHGLISYTEPYNGGPLEQMQVGSRIDINMGEFWTRTNHFKHSLKLASSIQHINGRKVVGAESFTGHALFSKWQEHPYALKALGDQMFTKGLNRMIFHRYAHQPHPTALPGMTMGPWGFHFDRTNTWFEKGSGWLNYLARCQYMLQQGLFVADLLYFTSEDAPGEDLSLKAAPTPAPPQGFDFDYIHSEALLTKVRIENNRIVLPDDMSYRVLVLPPRKTMSLAVVRKLHELVNQGMYLVGSKPEKVAGLAGFPNSDAELQKLTTELWGNAAAGGERSMGKGKIFVENSLVPVLARLNVQPDFTFTARSSDPMVNYIHRRAEDSDFYFISNGKRRTEELVCSFRMEGKKPEFWNADTGEMISVEIFEQANNRVTVPLRLDPAGSVFVLFRSQTNGRNFVSIARDNAVISQTSALPAPHASQYRNLSNNFTLTAWIKPEIEIAIPGPPTNNILLQRFGPKSFVFYPAAGETLYGNGHAIAGAVAGRNGVMVYERGREGMKLALTVETPLSGWTHLALVYKDGVPHLYLNGKLAGQGDRSKSTIHPGLGDEIYDESASFFEGDLKQPQVHSQVLSPEKLQVLAAANVPKMEELPTVEMAGKTKGELRFWQNGNYQLKDNSGKSTTLKIAGINKPIELKGSWKVAFPPNLGAPESVTLPQLISLHKHPEAGVKYFSGTATYSKNFSVPAGATGSGKRLFLDLGQVEVIADVTLNGKNLGILWKPPFRIDITEAAKAGENKLEVQVTNLWPNRLIGDEQLPPENDYGSIAFNQVGGIKEMPDWYVKGQPKPKTARVTFTTWKHYSKESPLLESGLVGPVSVLTAMQVAPDTPVKVS